MKHNLTFEDLEGALMFISFDTVDEEGTCVFSGKPSQRRVLFARSY